MDLPDEFEIARIASAGNGTEGGTPENPVRIVQRRRIRDIKRLRPKLEAQPFRDAKCLPDHQVGVLQTRPPHRVPRAVSDYELRSRRKRSRVEVLRHAAPCKAVRIGDAI